MKSKYLYMLGLVTAAAALFSYFYLDIPVASYFFSIKNNPPGQIVKSVSGLGRGEWYLIPSAMVAIIFWKRKRHIAHKGLYIFSVVAVSGILVNIIKLITRRVRPTLYFSEGLYGLNFFEFDSDFMSFPSGHSATSMSAAVALGFLFPKLRIPFLIVGIMIAFTRMFLTNHFLSDVMVGGVLGAVTSIYLYHVYFKQRMERQTDPPPLQGV